MVKSYDWLVIGGGITGSALAYELQSQGWKVLLLEPSSTLENATRYSYGGLPFWMGKTPEMRELCREGIRLHRQLPQKLDGETEFQEINLLLTITNDQSPDEILEQYQDCEIPPQLLSPKESSELEPLLNPNAIAGTICFPHGHINPKKTNEAYWKALMRRGGMIINEAVESFQIQQETIIGVETTKNRYYAEKTVVCAGGLTRNLLGKIGVKVPVYFTHAELLETPPIEWELKSLIMPANNERLNLETIAAAPEKEVCWEEKNGEELAPAIIEPGGVQFRDRHLCLGQISRTISDPDAKINLEQSESWLRKEVGKLLPQLQDVPADLKRCLIAFSPQSQSFVEKVENYEGIYVFSGFTSTLLLAPILAQRFARSML